MGIRTIALTNQVTVFVTTLYDLIIMDMLMVHHASFTGSHSPFLELTCSDISRILVRRSRSLQIMYTCSYKL